MFISKFIKLIYECKIFKLKTTNRYLESFKKISECVSNTILLILQPLNNFNDENPMVALSHKIMIALKCWSENLRIVNSLFHQKK